MARRIAFFASGAAVLMSVGLCAQAAVPLVETIDMLGSGDIADDTALWLHPTDRSKSIILGSNKDGGSYGGIYGLGLDGQRWDSTGSWGATNWFGQGKKLNEVDLSYSFQAGPERWDIVAAANRTDDRVDFFRVTTDLAGDFSGLASIGNFSTSLLGGDNPYGLTLFHSSSLDKHYAIASSKDGSVAQWELGYGAGSVTGTKVWEAQVSSSEVEGMVPDDVNEVIYISGENTSLYRYKTSGGVIQDAGRVTVDSVSGPHLTADIEGLTLYYGSDGSGYLIASSQGSNQFAVYDRQYVEGAANPHLFNFTVDENSGAGIDGVSDTDGIDVTNANLGGQFSSGVFFAHDNNNSGHPISNIKLVSWSDVADEITPNLIIDTTWDPRTVGPPVPGDTNGNRIVNDADYYNLVAQFGGAPGAESADFNADGIVDLEDFIIMRENFGFGVVAAPGAGPYSAAPEPATMAILAIGALAALRKRRR
jgi:3-phytase